GGLGGGGVDERPGGGRRRGGWGRGVSVALAHRDGNAAADGGAALRDQAVVLPQGGAVRLRAGVGAVQRADGGAGGDRRGARRGDERRLVALLSGLGEHPGQRRAAGGAAGVLGGGGGVVARHVG